VITYVPNLERATRDRLSVDVYRFQAGKHKRTVDVFGPVTEEGKAKLTEELDDVHHAFKEHVRLFRGDKIKDLGAVTTGEAWLSVQALELGLVDDIATSDDVIASFLPTHDVLVVADWPSPRRGASVWRASGCPRGCPVSGRRGHRRRRRRGFEPRWSGSRRPVVSPHAWRMWVWWG